MDVIKQFLLCGALKPQVIDPIVSAKLYKLNVPTPLRSLKYCL